MNVAETKICEVMLVRRNDDEMTSQGKGGNKLLTLSLVPITRAHPLMTKGSFAATTAMTSTPLALNSSYFSR